MPTVYLTFNFVLERWTAPLQGALWLLVQPHVVEPAGAQSDSFPELLGWIDGCEQAANSQFAEWCAAACPTDRVTPVPFPSDSTIAVILAHADGSTVARTVNELASRVSLSKPALFTAVNREPRLASAPESNVEPLQEIGKGPFAAAYNSALKEAAKSTAKDPARLAAMLQLAFWGGSARLLPKTAVDLVTLDDNLFRTDGNDAAFRTNLHALLGLTFRLARNRPTELAALANVGQLSIEVNGVTVVRRDIAPFLTSIPALDATAEERSVTVTSDDLRHRVYVREAFRELEPVQGLNKSSKLFRLPAQDPEPAGCVPVQAVPWQPPTRLLVRAKRDTPSSQQSWQAWHGIDGALRPYRSCPPGDTTLLQFIPNEPARELHQQLATDGQATGYLAAARLLVDGELLPIRTGDDHQVGSLSFIGAYELPWDSHHGLTDLAPTTSAAERTILFLGKSPTKETAILLVPIGGQLNISFFEPAADTLLGDAARRESETQDRQRDSLGRRWELPASAIPQQQFDTLQCLGDLDADLRPTLSFPSLLDFAFAQSVSSIEVAATATHVGLTTGLDASSTYREELVNFNALNVYADGEHLNPFTQVLPSSREEPAGIRRHRFVFRAELPTRPEAYEVDPEALPFLSSRFPRVRPSARAFFAELYHRMGNNRALGLRLEHTLGQEIEGSQHAPQSSATYGDFRVALPTDVARRKPKPDDRERVLPFLSINYHLGNGRETVTLSFQTSWLREEDLNDAARDVHVEAWRSVAELAHAASIRLRPRFSVFDFARALRTDRVGPRTLGQGLTWVEGAAWDITSDLGPACQAWMAGNRLSQLPPLQRPAQEVPVNALYVEWELVVSRSDTKAPPADPGWDIQWRPVPPWRPLEPRTATEPAVQPVFERFLRELHERCSVIPASREPSEEKALTRAFALLGTKAKAANGWIPLPSNPVDEGSTSAVVCPVAFAPLPRDDRLGDQTLDAVCRYMEILGQLLAFDRETTGAPQNPKALRSLFRSREELAKANLAALIEAALASLAATPQAGDGALSAAEQDQAGTLHMAVREAIRGQLWRAPATYSQVKAFLVTLLSGGSSAAPRRLPTQLVTLIARRAISDSRADRVDLSFFHAQDAPPDGSHLRFIEALDHARFDSAFSLPLQTGLVWRALADEVASTHAVRERSDHQPQRLLPGNSQTLVRLPSRRGLTRPGSVFAGFIEAFQEAPPTAERVTQKLLSGLWQPSASGELRLIGSSSPLTRRERPDESVFSMIYWVVGDEDQQKGFDNDRFRLFQVPEANREDEPKKAGTSPSVTGATFFDLLHQDPAHLDVQMRRNLADQCIQPENIDSVTAALKAIPLGPLAGSTPILEFGLHRNGDRVAIDGVTGRFEVAVLAPATSTSTQSHIARVLLLVNATVSSWEPKAFRLLQTRNFEGFAARFHQSSLASGEPLAYQRTVARDLATESAVLIPRQLTLERFLHATVGRYFSGEPKPRWADFDLSITIRHHQLMTWLCAGSGSTQREVGHTVRASFPLLNYRHRPGSNARSISLPAPYTDFLVDFQWSSATNLQFLRLSNVRVTAS
jgi:hypothetical protein